MKGAIIRGQITDAKAAMEFMLAGKSTVTFVSKKTGERFTYSVKASDKSADKDFRFVALLNGPDNTSDYAYIGIIRNRKFIWTKKSKVGKNAPSVKGFEFCFNQALAKGLIVGFEVWHEGRCGRCGRKLTVPESIASGFGPECIGLMGGAVVKPVTGKAAPVTAAQVPTKTSVPAVAGKVSQLSLF